MNNKRKYYVLSPEVINHIKISALKENTTEHCLVNRILSQYDSEVSINETKKKQSL